MCSPVTSQLPIKEYPDLMPHQVRVLHLNPAEVYARINVNHFERFNRITMAEMWPKIDGHCSCGCGVQLSGRRHRWVSDECQSFAMAVNNIINGNGETITNYLRYYLGYWACIDCGVMDIYQEYKNGLIVDGIHKDHKIPVKHGGGGCWLLNFELRCYKCHKQKTNSDFKRKEYKEPTVIEYNLPTLFNMSEIF